MRDWESHFRKVSRAAKTVAEPSLFGSDGSPAVALQQALNHAGALPQLKEDGIVGPATVTALKAFQARHHLTVDGVPGPQTLQALGLPAQDEGILDSITSAVSGAIQGLKDSVLEAFTGFTTKFEGKTPYLYTDVKGLVTTGIGNLVDNGNGMNGYGPATALPWKHPNGLLATQPEVIAAWQKVKSAWPGVQSTASAKLTDIRLDDAAIADLVNKKVASNHSILKTKYPGYVNWPADAQMGLHSIAWAAGPAVHLPAFSAAVNQTKPDFITAASESQLNAKGNPGLVPRNAATKQLFLNAADVQKKGANYNTLFYPNVVTAIAVGITGLLMMIGIGILVFFGLAESSSKSLTS
jgi:GH24 family phage-related lysozyme (muramidase)